MNLIKEAIEIDKKYKKLLQKQSELMWIQMSTGLDTGLGKAYEAIMKMQKNIKNHEIINKVLERPLNNDDRKRVEFLKKSFQPYTKELYEIGSKENELVGRLEGLRYNFRFKIDGKEITMPELNKILHESGERTERKKAYLAQTQINKPLVDNGFIDLINLRKEAAKQLGFKSFPEMMLKDVDELDINTFNTLKKEAFSLVDSVNKTRNEYGIKYLNMYDLQPWDASYLTSKIAPLRNFEFDMRNFYEPVRKTFLEFGFDISKYNITYDIIPRRNKSEGGFCWPVNQGVDVRILSNVKDRFHEFNIMLHETGHAIHIFNIDHNDIFSRRQSPIVNEAFGDFFGYLHLEEIFYKHIFDIKQSEQAEKQFADYKKWYKLTQIRFINSIIFDQELYKTNIQNLDDINHLKWKLDKQLLGQESYGNEPIWGYVPHHTSMPIMLHSYLMADVTIEMMKKVFMKRNNIDSIFDKPEEFGKFLLKELLLPSGKLTFDEIFENISGEKFSLKFLDV